MILSSKAHRHPAGLFPLGNPQIRGQIYCKGRNVCVSKNAELKSAFESDGLFVSNPYLQCTVWPLVHKSKVHIYGLSLSMSFFFFSQFQNVFHNVVS